MKADIGKVASKMWFDFMLTSTRKYYFIYYGQFHVIFVETITCRDFFFCPQGSICSHTKTDFDKGKRNTNFQFFFLI